MNVVLPTEGASLNRRKRILAAWLIFFLIFAFAASLRFADLDEHLSLSQDESTMLEFTRGLLVRGYPFFYRGQREVSMATYELVPYFIALAVRLLGWSEFAVRLPAVLFGLGTLCLIFVAGRVWFDVRVALWTAFLYAISPWAIYWAQDCFYPSQLQFFTMLSTLVVYRVLRATQVIPRDYYLAAFFLCLTYLSWEGSALLFLAYGFMAVWLRWGRWNFLRSGHTWLALGIVAVVVIGQLVRRLLLQTPYYLGVGYSLAQLSTPQIAMPLSTYNPLYYLQNIFASEQHLLLSAVFLVGIVFLRRDWSLRFVYGLIFLAIAAYTELLPVAAPRYVYMVLPVFLIGAAAATIRLLDWIAKGRAAAALISVRTINLTVALTVLALQGLVLSVAGLNLSELNTDYYGPGPWELRPDIAGVDYRHVMRALAREYRAGDIVIVRSPSVLDAYTGLRGDYTLQRITTNLVIYEPLRGLPYFGDKFVGNPVLRSQAELEDVLQRYNRVWFVVTPVGLTRDALGEELFQWVQESMVLKAEGYNSRLYLWERK